MTDALLYIALWLDSAPGYRGYLVLRAGRKWIWLLNTEDTSAHRVTVPEYASALKKARPLASTPSRMSAQLRRIAKIYGTTESAAVKFALALIRIAAHKRREDRNNVRERFGDIANGRD